MGCRTVPKQLRCGRLVCERWQLHILLVASAAVASELSVLEAALQLSVPPEVGGMCVFVRLLGYILLWLSKL
jgi:hypothetical protein